MFVGIFGFLEMGRVNNCVLHVLDVRVLTGISLKETNVELMSSWMYNVGKNVAQSIHKK
jgi:hypothetical protein